VSASDAIARARAAWPGVPLDEAAFQRRLEALAATAPDRQEWLLTAPIEDLAIAFACASGDRAALRELERVYFGELRAAISAAGVSHDDAPEILQEVRARLLVAEGGGLPRIAHYAGRGPLVGWLRVAAVRVALGERRKREARPEARVEEEALEHLAPRTGDPEVGHLRDRYGREFDRALAAALASLEPDDRTLLRLYYVSSVGVEKLGTLHRVHASTISRRLARARRMLLDEARRLLRASLRVSPAELESLLRAVRSGLHLSLSRLEPRE
jgi:RNA polymerase sigma-70 factor (ECF subfamily)